MKQMKKSGNKEFDIGFQAGRNEGTMEEAINSLRKKLTDRELDALTIIVWHSDVMQSIRNRLSDLEGKNKEWCDRCEAWVKLPHGCFKKGRK